jgi:hypothetical protein
MTKRKITANGKPEKHAKQIKTIANSKEKIRKGSFNLDAEIAEPIYVSHV